MPRNPEKWNGKGKVPKPLRNRNLRQRDRLIRWLVVIFIIATLLLAANLIAFTLFVK